MHQENRRLKIRRLYGCAAAELNAFTYPKGDRLPTVDEEALGCLIHALENQLHPNIARPVVRAATW